MPSSESKCDSPVRANSDSPGTLAISFQRVQPKGRLVHILNLFRSVERREDQTQPVELISLEFSPIIMLEQELQALMPQTSNHRCDCKTSFDICQQRQRITGSRRQQAEQPDCSRYLSNESCAESAHRVRSLPPPFADSVALSSTRRAPSWPGPLGRSQLVLARLHRSRPLQPADMPVACR